MLNLNMGQNIVITEATACYRSYNYIIRVQVKIHSRNFSGLKAHTLLEPNNPQNIWLSSKYYIYLGSTGKKVKRFYSTPKVLSLHNSVNILCKLLNNYCKLISHTCYFYLIT